MDEQPVVRFFITGTDPLILARCFTIARKVKSYISEYADVRIYVVPPLTSLCRGSITVEDVGYVMCEDDEENLIEQLIEMSAKAIIERSLVGESCAAGVNVGSYKVDSLNKLIRSTQSRHSQRNGCYAEH